MNCLIVEDEPLARNLLTEYVRKVPYLHLLDACSSPLAAIDLLRREPVDLLFLDIQMPEITGITLLKILQKRPLVILTTAYSEYALEGYELDVVDYLLKPVTLERFLKAVDKAAQRLGVAAPPVPAAPAAEPAPPFVFVKDGTKLVKVRWNDILYVEGLKDYVVIHTRTQKIVTLQRLKSLENQLPADRFIRIHHSYIIALDAIDVVHKGEVQIGTALIPVSDSYRKTFREFIDRNQIQPE
ncbi:MAG: response regulator transcription factor [Cytophagales bacterium]|nr:response regulator transcription factor [Cytophagales bacterium]